MSKGCQVLCWLFTAVWSCAVMEQQNLVCPFSLMPYTIDTLFYDLGQCVHTWLPANDGCRQLTHLPSTRTTWPIFVRDIMPLTDAVILLKGNLKHPLLPFTRWKLNYPCPVTRPIFEWLDISVHTLQQVSIIYERPSYKCHKCMHFSSIGSA
jgi:hypothetical protein